MTAELDLTRLKGRRLFVATPMYDGRCHSEFTFAIAQLSSLCTQLGVALRFFFACHEALITKARNISVDEFLRAGDDTLIFIDADIGFDARDVLHLMALQDAERAFDVISAPYPLKRLNWENLRTAVRAGLADDDPAALARYASRMAISPAQDRTFAIGAPVEVTEAGTGFMMIRRETFERFRAYHPSRRYRPERVGLDEGASTEISAFFETEVDGKQANLAEEIRSFLAREPDATSAEVLAFLDDETATTRAYSGHYVSEDYAFCRRVREAGMRVWSCPWIELSHTGSHRFVSRLIDLAAIGAV